jgi:DNA topoisomerase-1
MEPGGRDDCNPAAEQRSGPAVRAIMPLDVAPQGPVFAEAAGLSYVQDIDPGLRRRRAGRGFAYLDTHGRRIDDAATLERIRGLVIPPAWTDVWICPDPAGHIQATGRDQKGRKQYIYHPDWRAHRDASKYGHMAAFGRALPRLRARVDEDLRRHGLPRQKVLAAVVRLLELTLIRIGNDEYAAANDSYGLTTLRKRHVDLNGTGAVFEFQGKSGRLHRTGFRDRRLAAVVRRCEELPGQRLFQYVDEYGERRAVSSHDVNAYIREATGGPFTAKDFRTWSATLHCAQDLARAGPSTSAAGLKRTVAACIRRTAGLLGNTPSVCRASYVHPAVLQCYADGALVERLARPNLADAEKALLKMLDELDA